MKPKVSDIKKWVAALRSGEYTQTRKSLQDETGYCCLGVACKLFIPKKDLEFTFDGFGEDRPELRGVAPIDQPESPSWLKEISTDFAAKTGTSLMLLNDGQLHPLNIVTDTYSFDEIADMLEAVYVYKVLE